MTLPNKVTILFLSGVATIMPLHITAASPTDALKITAIVGKEMKSTVECWTLEPTYKHVRGVSLYLRYLHSTHN